MMRLGLAFGLLCTFLSQVTNGEESEYFFRRVARQPRRCSWGATAVSVCFPGARCGRAGYQCDTATNYCCPQQQSNPGANLPMPTCPDNTPATSSCFFSSCGADTGLVCTSSKLCCPSNQQNNPNPVSSTIAPTSSSSTLIPTSTTTLPPTTTTVAQDPEDEDDDEDDDGTTSSSIAPTTTSTTIAPTTTTTTEATPEQAKKKPARAPVKGSAKKAQTTTRKPKSG